MYLTWRSPFRFARAMWHAFVYWRDGLRVLAPKGIVEYRRAICAPCKWNDRGLCRKCSCFIDVKTLLASEECPDAPPRWKKLTFSKKQPIPQ